MTFLPIVARELIEAGRRRSTYWTRIGVALSALVIGAFVMLGARNSHPSELGLSLFIPLAVLTHLYCLLVGVFRTADCLSEEKREGTLGLLFLTDLKGYDIVLGKLAATSLNAIYGLLAVFPIMAVPVLAGGVAIEEVWRTALVALNNLFFSLAVGMFCSAISRDERKAMVLAFLTVLFFTAGLPLLGVLVEMWWHSEQWMVYYLMPGSPAYPCFLAFEDMARSSAAHNYFLQSILFIHALSWALLVLACYIVPRTWQDRALSAAATRRQSFWRRLAHGSAAWRAATRRRLLEINPVLWLAGRERLKPVLVWLFLGAGAIIWALGLIFEPQDWKQAGAYACTALLAHTVLKVWLVSEATRRFSLDRQSGALELLLSTPLTVREITRGQTRALEKQFAGPAFVVLLADFVFLMAGRQESAWIWFMVTAMVVFVADLVTLAWVGMWRGLNSRRPNRAAAAVIARIMILPWVIFGIMLFFIVLMMSSGTLGGVDDGNMLFLLALGIAIVVNLAFGLPAHRRLHEEFRTVATTRFEKKSA